MSHNNYIYKRNHWQLHLKKVIQKERYPWLSYQSLCRKKKPGVLLFWTSRCGLVVRQNPPRNTEACSSKMAWPVLHGVTGPITPSRLCVPLRLGRFAGCFGGSCVSLFFFLGETTEKQNLWFKCFFRQFACVVRFTTTIYNYVCLWSFALNFLWSSQKAGGIPSHPNSCHQKPNSFSLHDITSQFPTHVSFHTKRNKHIKSLKW